MEKNEERKVEREKKKRFNCLGIEEKEYLKKNKMSEKR